MRQLLVVLEYLDAEASSNATPPGPPLPLQCLLYGTLHSDCQGAWVLAHYYC